jgi:putative two-component system response regulator
MNLKTILIVDDEPGNIDVLKAILKPDYAIRAANSGRLALKIATSDNPPDLILLDVCMPELDGYEAIRLLKDNQRTQGIPVIFVTARCGVDEEALGFALGAEDYIIKPVSAPVVSARVATHLALNDRSRLLDELVRQRTALLEKKTVELEETRMQILRRLGRAGEYRDNETGMHVLRLSQYVSALGHHIGLLPSEIESISQAALMHDIGKIGIPDHILLKPGTLDAGEFEIVKQHCQIGADIIGFHDSKLLQMCRDVALTHHERWDGSGYPTGIAGADIPLAGRMTAIADIFDALTSARPYKKAWSFDRSLRAIAADAGHALDPSMVAAFIDLGPQLQAIMTTYSDSLVEDKKLSWQ